MPNCAMYLSAGSDDGRCKVFISKGISEAMYLVLSMSFTYCSGGGAN